MDGVNKSLGKVSTGAPCKPSGFTFVPVVQKLPFKSIITEQERPVALTGKQNTERVSDREAFKAEVVFIKDFMEGGAGNITQPETKSQWKPSLDPMSLSDTKASPSVSSQSENTSSHLAALTASMETAADKHKGTSQQQRRDSSERAEVSLGCFVNRASVSEDKMSPTDSTDLFPTPASSRESILSEGSDKEKSWSAMRLSSVTSPVTLSCTISACSSVRSGIFSPAVVQFRRHFLAPGTSLVNIPQTCFSSCGSLSCSVCPQSRPRRRPPLTRLSLLTAILRKGRLPVLSSALKRPYTPCWPVNPVTLSFCKACSAASSVASIPLEISSRFPSSPSTDFQSQAHRKPNRSVTAPQPQVKRCSEHICSSSVPRREQVTSPPPVKRNTLLPPPLPMFCSNFKSVSLPKHEEISDCPTSNHTHISISKSHELKPSNLHMYLKGHADNNLKELIPPSPKLNEQKTSAPKKQSHSSNSSLLRLRLLSERLRSPPVCPPQPQISQSDPPGVAVFSAHTDAPSPPTPLQTITGRCESERSCPDSKGSTPSHGFHKAHCLPPSCYIPIVFPGWPSPTSSPTPTPSPAPPVRELTLSPAFSLSPTPSPRPGSGISDCSDRDGKKRKTHKIKPGYKSLAAIPTNTLLLDQQAIDEQVERATSSCDTLDRSVSDTHSEMCSPAELRQKSEELYTVIDEILANSIPPCKTSPSPQLAGSSTTSAGFQQNKSSLPKSLGRETKYASICSLHPSTGVGRKLTDPKTTKPGIIRPMTAIPRLTVEDKEEFHPKPLRRFVAKQTLTDYRKVENMHPEEAGKGFYTSSKGQVLKEERKSERKSSFSACDLQITEPEDQSVTL